MLCDLAYTHTESGCCWCTQDTDALEYRADIERATSWSDHQCGACSFVSASLQPSCQVYGLLTGLDIDGVLILVYAAASTTAMTLSSMKVINKNPRVICMPRHAHETMDICKQQESMRLWLVDRCGFGTGSAFFSAFGSA